MLHFLVSSHTSTKFFVLVLSRIIAHFYQALRNIIVITIVIVIVIVIVLLLWRCRFFHFLCRLSRSSSWSGVMQISWWISHVIVSPSTTLIKRLQPTTIVINRLLWSSTDYYCHQPTTTDNYRQLLTTTTSTTTDNRNKKKKKVFLRSFSTTSSSALSFPSIIVSAFPRLLPAASFHPS